MKKLAELLDAKVLADPLTEAESAALVRRHRCLGRGYDDDACREAAVARGYTPHIPPQRSAGHPLPPPGHPDRHPPRRWVVEVAHRWCNRFRRLLTRWDKRAADSRGFVQLAACLIIYRKVRHAPTSLGEAVSSRQATVEERPGRLGCADAVG
jgi:transposase